MRGADGLKIAVLREGRANLALIWAAAHASRYAYEYEMEESINFYYCRSNCFTRPL